MKRQAMEWLSQVYPELSTEYEEVESLAELLRSVAARAVEEERMACAADQCDACREPETFWPVKKVNGRWQHEYKDLSYMVYCDAPRIHERSQVKGEGL